MHKLLTRRARAFILRVRRASYERAPLPSTLSGLEKARYTHAFSYYVLKSHYCFQAKFIIKMLLLGQQGLIISYFAEH